MLKEAGVLQRWVDDEHAVSDIGILIGVGGHFKLAVSVTLFSTRTRWSVDVKVYPNPPTSTSFVQMLLFKPFEKSS